MNPTIISALTRLTAAASLSLSVQAALAAVLRVGPEREIATIAKAATVAEDGDTVLIDPGRYQADVAVWTQRELTIRGDGGRAVLEAGDELAESKAIWVFRNGDFDVENIEFRGARAASGNGAGIRFERGRLHLRNSVFSNNQMGLLSGHDRNSELIVENCRFDHAPRQHGSLPHLLYVGSIAHFELRGSRFSNGFRGHLVKSRARRNTVRYNLIFDGPQGAASYLLEFPDGGQAQVVGNIIGQSAASGNRALIAYGAENPTGARQHQLIVTHNTLVSAGPAPARFLRIWQHNLPDTAHGLARNNLLLGIGRIQVPHTRGPDRTEHNVKLADRHLRRLDLESAKAIVTHPFGTLDETSVPAVEAAYRPEAHFTLPVGTREMPQPRHWIAGALQSPLSD